MNRRTSSLLQSSIMLLAGISLGWWGFDLLFTRQTKQTDADLKPIVPPPIVSKTKLHPSATTDPAIRAIWEAGGVGAQMLAAVEWAESIQPGDFDQAMKQLRDLPPHSAAGLAERVLLARWIEVDPESALKQEVSTCATDANSLFSTLSYSLAKWARQDRQAAERFANQQREPRRSECLAGLVLSLADTDPEAALAQASMVNGRSINRLIAAFQKIAERNPESLLQQVGNYPPDLGSHLRTAALEAWAKIDFQAARSWAEQQPNPKRSLIDLITSSKTPNQDVLTALGTLPAAEQKSLLGSLSSEWERSLGPKFADFCLEQASHAHPEMQGEYLLSAVSRLPVQKMEQLAKRLETDFPSSLATLTELSARWATIDSEAARRWANSLADPFTRATINERISNVEAYQHIEENTNLVDKLMGKVKNNDNIEAVDIRRLDFDQSIALIQHLSLQEKKEHFFFEDPNITKFVSAISQSNPQEFSSWLTTKAPKAIAEAQIPSLAKTWASEAPAEAAAWVESLPHTMPRTKALRSINNTWSSFDPKAAENWKNTLSEEDRQSLVP